MYGSTVNYLRVIVKKKRGDVEELWKMSGNQGRMWIPVEIKYTSLDPHQVSPFLLGLVLVLVRY